ncbi:alpha/beta fold hydrolase [Acidimangrovimonas pyrenivorans]|uniref:Alpha/beta fold hydrolase n=1 Tax=Acidimangrovimonas pyrenivorans TaxID=2030798 RepID=A0ABV7AG81_9RHOB
MATVLVPGFMLDADLWGDIIDDLAPFGPIVHADPTRGDTIEAMASETLKIAPERFDLIGFSMGGYVARAIQRLAPERVGRLVLIATSARGDGEIQAQRKLAMSGAELPRFRGISRQSIRKSLSPQREGDAALVERIRDMSLRLGGETFHRQARLRREDDLDRLASIACPTLIVAGSEDRLRSLDEARELKRAIWASELRVIEAGHMIPLEAPRVLSAAVTTFLNGGPGDERQARIGPDEGNGA